MFYPAIATAALFTAIIIHDAMVKESSSIPTHAFLGLISVLAMFYLSMKGADVVAWGILVLPMFIIALSFVLVYTGTKTMASTVDSSSSVAPANSVARVSPISPAGPAPAPATSPSCNCGSTVNLPKTTDKASSTVVTPATNCALHV